MIKTRFVFPTIRTGFPAFFLSLGLAITSLPAQAAVPVGAEERFACSAPEEAEMGEPVICRTQLSAKGKPLVVDPGVGSYDSPSVGFFKSRRAHNVLTVDNDDYSSRPTDIAWRTSAALDWLLSQYLSVARSSGGSIWSSTVV